MKKQYGQIVLTAKGVYLCFLTVYALLREVLAIQKIAGSSVITYGFFGVGVLVAAASFICNKKAFFRKSLWLPMVFLVICIVSTLVNHKHDFMANIKAVSWMLLYFTLLLPQSKNKAGERRVRKWVMVTALVTMTVLVFISLPMYFFNVDYTYVKDTGFVNNQGFSHQYMRLWGVFNDANTAAIYSILCICFAAYLFIKSKKKAVRILLVFSCVMLFQIVVLSSSRSAMVAFAAAVIWVGLCIAFSGTKDDKRKRIIASVLATVIAAGASLGLYMAVKFLMPYEKLAIQNIASQSFQAAIHKAYDGFYKSSGLNITEGYYVEPPVVPEPVTPEPSQPELTTVPTSDTVTEITEPETTVTEPETTVTEPETTVTEPVTQSPVTEPMIPTEPATEVVKPAAEDLGRTDKKDDLSNGRFKKWRETFEVFQNLPILGASPRGISSAAKQINPNGSVAKFNMAAHNSLLEVLAGTGILGFLAVIGILVCLVMIILKKLFSGKTNYEFIMFSAVLLVVAVEMIFLSDVFFSLTFGGIAFWMASGRILAAFNRSLKGWKKK